MRPNVAALLSTIDSHGRAEAYRKLYAYDTALAVNSTATWVTVSQCSDAYDNRAALTIQPGRFL